MAAPTSTTNMTGFLSWTRGASFLKASGVDFHSILGSSSPPPIRRSWLAARLVASPPACGVVVTAISVQSFGERAQRKRGEVGQADQYQDHADDHPDEQRRPGVEGPSAGMHGSLA